MLYTLEEKEDMFLSGAEALVNPVNIDGIMGGGLALEFKRRFPEMFLEYRELCLRGDFTKGELHTFKAQDVWIVNLPTKEHIYQDSSLSLIILGLCKLDEFVMKEKVRSIAVPKLGCGLGGLDWTTVGPVVTSLLEVIAIKNKADVYLYV